MIQKITQEQLNEIQSHKKEDIKFWLNDHMFFYKYNDNVYLYILGVGGQLEFFVSENDIIDFIKERI